MRHTMPMPPAGPGKIVVVVPFLNEAESLPVLYERLRAEIGRAHV